MKKTNYGFYILEAFRSKIVFTANDKILGHSLSFIHEVFLKNVFGEILAFFVTMPNKDTEFVKFCVNIEDDSYSGLISCHESLTEMTFKEYLASVLENCIHNSINSEEVLNDYISK